MQWILPVKSDSFRGEAGFMRLRQVVEEQERVTRLVQIEDPRHVLLNRNTGVTVQGLSFNRDAFWQVCRVVAGGLFATLQTAWSESHAVPETSRQVLLLRAYNALVKVRWEALEGWRMVVDTRSKVIVGLVGKKYHFVSNQYIMELVRSKMAATKTSYQFVQGIQRNRDMFFTLAGTKLTAAGPGLQLRQGVAVVNSETTHRAIFFPRVIFDSVTNTFAMEPESKRNRLPHRKRRRFSDLLSELAEQVFKNEIEGSKLSNAYRAMRSGVLEQDENELVGGVMQYAIDNRVSAEIAMKVAAVLKAEAASTNSQPLTQWSVYASFLRVAGESYGFDRQLRQCAYRLLRG